MAINNYMWFNATVADVKTALIPQNVQHIAMLTPILGNVFPHTPLSHTYYLLAHFCSQIFDIINVIYKYAYIYTTKHV